MFVNFHPGRTVTQTILRHLKMRKLHRPLDSQHDTGVCSISSSPQLRESPSFEFGSSSSDLPDLGDLTYSGKERTVSVAEPRTVGLTPVVNQSRPQARPAQTPGRPHVSPTASIWDLWSEDDFTPPPSNQNAFLAKLEERQHQERMSQEVAMIASVVEEAEDKSSRHESDVLVVRKTEIHQPEVAGPVIESTKQLARTKRQKQGPQRQTILTKGKMTKPAVKEKSCPEKHEKISRHFPKAQKPLPVPPGESLGLGAAISRRTDWTPTKGSKVVDLTGNLQTYGHFKSLVESFGTYKDGPAESRENLCAPHDVLKKRKLIEMVIKNNGADSKGDTSPAPKATKKKARTLTELATAAYASGEDDDICFIKPERLKKCKSPKFHKCLSYGGKDKVITRRGTGKMVKVSTKPKPSSKSVKPKETILPILLSPAAAIKEAGNQDFVFGTSSQLVREQSPTMLKDMQRALEASLKDIDKEFPNIETNLKGVQGSREKYRLWTAGARTDKGELMEIVNLVDAVEVPPEVKPHAGVNKTVLEHTDMENLSFDDSLALKPPPHDSSLTAKPESPRELGAAMETPESSATALPTPAPTAKKLHPTSEPVPQHKTTTEATTPHVPSKPHYELFTDAQLAREISSYGFKSIKRRTAMVALLDECWASKHGIPLPVPGDTSRAISSTAGTATAARKKSKTVVTTSKPESAPPKRLRGRPRNKVDNAGDATAMAGSSISAACDPAPSVPKRSRPIKASEVSSSAAKSPAPSSNRTNLPVKSPRTKKTSGPKTRAKKVSLTESQHQDTPLVIADSESDTDSSLSILTSPKSAKTAGAAENSELPQSLLPRLSLSFPGLPVKSSLNAAITKAVITAPRTEDPKNPSWYERILMYDPLIIEDLTQWLNGGELKRVGWFGDGRTAESMDGRSCNQGEETEDLGDSSDAESLTDPASSRTAVNEIGDAAASRGGKNRKCNDKCGCKKQKAKWQRIYGQEGAARTRNEGVVSALDVKLWCESKSVCCVWRETRGRDRKRL